MPCGIVRLSRRSGTIGLARSRNQASLLLSVSVTRGGGLNVEADVTLEWACRFSRTAANTEDSTCKPERCFNWAYREGRAVFDSF